MATPTATPLRELLDELTDTVGRPMATIYLPLPSASEDAPQKFDIRRRNLGRDLTDAGADEAIVAVVDRTLAERQHLDGAALLIVADADRALIDRPLFRPVSRELFRLGPVPALLPALRAEQDDLDHVAVLVDRAGADVWVRSNLDHSEQTTEVKGDTEHIHRSKPGGWSQRRFQQRSENTWESNASEVVDELLELVDLDRLDRIVVAGDTRAVGFFTEHLPVRGKERLIEVDGSRHADHDAFLDAADIAIRTAARENEVAEIRQLREDLATGTSVQGVEVLSLLAEGRVERLFVVDDTEADDRVEVAFTVDPLLGGPMAEEMSATERASATDLAVIMARRMGSAIHVLPSAGVGLPDAGLAARLRG